MHTRPPFTLRRRDMAWLSRVTDNSNGDKEVSRSLTEVAILLSSLPISPFSPPGVSARKR